MKELNLVLKGDVSGRSRRSRTRSPSCRRTRSSVNIIRRGVGGITESDVMLAAASTR